ncbi:hypothetical protein ACGF07_20935 [Kitasatospora sp. NPDC048194]|uniref:hypothetical protein n=1 Tax=Kitasatospora sp. NPDC048194 TaxID=3364045 RepID=UPI00371F832A
MPARPLRRVIAANDRHPRPPFHPPPRLRKQGTGCPGRELTHQIAHLDALSRHDEIVTD